MRKCLSLILLVFFLLAVPVFSVQPSQQYAKLFYSPYYVASMTQNVNTTFSVAISPPDGFSATQSAVLNFQVYAMPSVTFTLFVDGKVCSPSSFSINTQYAGASLLPFSFDCSNVISHSGIYTIKLLPSRDTGAIYGWLDITYSNAPKSGSVSIHGTEYFAGDTATLFLQLTDGDDAPINAALCKVDVYAPSSYNVSHIELLNDQNMILKEEGIYYYDWQVPNYTGIYMVNAKCSKATTIRYYSSEQTIVYPVVALQTGTISGTNQSLNSYEDNAYVSVDVATGVTSINVTFNNVSIANASEISYNTFFQAGSARDMTISVWNFTSSSFVPIANIVTVSRGGAIVKIGYDGYRSFSISNSSGALLSYLKNQSMIFRVNTSGGAGIFDYNAIWLYATNFDYSYPPVLRGSGEIHVSQPNYTSIYNSILVANNSVHSALANNFTDTNALISSSFSSLNFHLIGNFTEKDLAIESTNRTLHDAIFWNFSNLNISAELPENFTLNCTPDLTNITGGFTQLQNTTSVTKAIILAIIVVAVIYFLWRMFK
jgi:hypothetical protein